MNDKELKDLRLRIVQELGECIDHGHQWGTPRTTKQHSLVARGGLVIEALQERKCVRCGYEQAVTRRVKVPVEKVALDKAMQELEGTENDTDT